MKNLLILPLLIIGMFVHATTYYFSTSDGLDSRTTAQAQNSATPWQTLSKFNSFFSSLQPGDFVLFKRGDTFLGTMTINKSGTSGNPITIGAYGTGAKPIISGSYTIPAWTSIGNGKYEAVIPAALSTCGVLSMDNVFQPLGKLPKGNTGYFTASAGSSTSLTSSGISAVANFVGGEVVWRAKHWVLWRGAVTSQTSTTVGFTAFPSTSGGATEPAASGYGFFFQNSPAACTSLGEWAYDPTTHKVTICFTIAGPGTHVVKISTAQNIITDAGFSFVTFDNIAIQYGNTYLVSLNGASNIRMTACDLAGAGVYGIFANGNSPNFAFINSTMDYAYSNAIAYSSGSGTTTITGSTFTNCGAVAGMGGSGEGQYFCLINVKSANVSNNVFRNMGYNVITFTGTNNTIKFNFIDSFCTIKDDGGAIYEGANPSTGTVVDSNIVLHGIGMHQGTPDAEQRVHGVYVDDGGSVISMTGNTFAFCGGGGMNFHNSHEITANNNTMYENAGGQIIYYNDGDITKNISLINNIFYAKTATYLLHRSSGGTKSPAPVGIDPGFFSTATNNYWCRPANENATFQILVPSSQTFNLTSWKTFIGKETNSKITPITPISTRFEYNATMSPVVVTLGANYMDVRGILYPGSITLAPFSSAVLLQTAGSNSLPTTNAGPDIQIILPVNSVTMAGNATDVDGTIASYLWTKTSGSATFTITTASNKNTTITGLIAGTYQFTLQATDNSGGTSTDIMQVVVNPAPNQSPVANAGADKNITGPANSVILTGSGTDADGTIASYAWTNVSGPIVPTIVSSTQAQTNITGLTTPGTYRLQLKVTDNNGATATDLVDIVVSAAPNQPPSANAGLDQTLQQPINSTSVTGVSSDIDGTVTSVQWTFISGPATPSFGTPNVATTTVTGLTVVGSYTLQFKATDNSTAFTTDLVVIQITAAPNQNPTANAGSDVNITLPANSVTLVGSGSDPDGTISAYLWTKTSGPTSFTIVSAAQAGTAITNLVQGVYVFDLRVTDNNGAVAHDQVTVTVNQAINQLPTANAGPNITITLPTNSASLVGSGTDPDGTIASYLWTKTAGPTTFTLSNSTLSTASVSNLVAGTYTFQLQVTDNRSGTATKSMTLIVNPAPNILPTVNAGIDQAITAPTNSVNLVGTGNDPDGTIAAYLWTKISGPTTFTIVSPTTASTVFNNLVVGVYVLRLQVTDNSGGTATNDIQITVNAAPPPNQNPIANAGNDKNITLPTNTTTQVGSGTDADGTVVAYAWTKISGPSTFTIASPIASTTAFNNLVQGTYVFQLQVTDNLGATGVDLVTVIVNAAPNQVPIANAGTDKNITIPVNSVLQVGSGTDADGTIASYSWTKVSGSSTFVVVSPTASTTTINNLVQGVYVFRLTVTDNRGATATDDVTIIVNHINAPPVVTAGPDIQITLPTAVATMAGNATDADGIIASHTWSLLTGNPTVLTITTVGSYTTTITGITVPGSYYLKLSATDDSSATRSDTMIILVNPAPNVLPVVNAGPDQQDTLPETATPPITLSGSATDADGTIQFYQWIQISGPSIVTFQSSTQKTTLASNIIAGVYQFRLKATDNSGGFTTDDVTVTVVSAIPPKAPVLPIVSAGHDQNPVVCLTCSTVSAAATGVVTQETYTIASYQWTKISGPSQFTINSPTSVSTTLSGLVRGTYQFQLTVTDGGGNVVTDIMQVNVKKQYLTFDHGRLKVVTK